MPSDRHGTAVSTLPGLDYPGRVSRTPVVVLISGTGSTLAALLESGAQPDSPYEIVGVIADKDAAGLDHARAAGVPTEVVRLADHPDRAGRRASHYA